MSPITVKYNTILHNNYNTNYSPYSYHIYENQLRYSCKINLCIHEIISDLSTPFK